MRSRVNREPWYAEGASGVRATETKSSEEET
jgi:hypothetical protein